MTHVVKISKSDYDVLTTTPQNLTFSSELATHCIYSVISFSFISGTEYTITHNLGYVPKVWVFMRTSTTLWDLPIITTSGSGLDYYITSTTIVVNRTSSGSWPDYTVIIFTRSPNP